MENLSEGKMIITGVDPGKSGAICQLNEAGDIVSLNLCPTVKVGKKLQYDLQAMRKLVIGSDQIWLERVHAMPGQGVSSMFSFGDGFGIWRGMAVALLIPLYYISPQKWKGKFGIKGDKNLAILRAKEIHPTINLKPSLRCRKDSVALAEAFLIARYGLEWGRNRAP